MFSETGSVYSSATAELCIVGTDPVIHTYLNRGKDDRMSKKKKKRARRIINPEKVTRYDNFLYLCTTIIFDDGQIVVLFNGFQKKTQKTPQNEIEKAIKIKEAYYADKQSQNR